MERVRPFDFEALINPYEMYKALRDRLPVHYIPEMNMHLVTRYDLIREAIKDTATFSSQMEGAMNSFRDAALAAAPVDIQQQIADLGQRMIATVPTMLTLDEPGHTRYRSLVGQLFTGSQVKKQEQQVRAVVEDRADRFVAGTEADFMRGFAFPVPLRIIGDRLGIPEEDRALFEEAATAAAAGLRISPISAEEMLRRAQLALNLQALLIRLIEMRRKDPEDDMISILATSRMDSEARQLNHGEALSILGQFLVAGHETTTSTFGWGMYLLCKQPFLQQALRHDSGAVSTFVEETLRLEAPVQGLPRVVTKDTELGGYPLGAGSIVMLRYGAANRDERQFVNPDEVDIHRRKAAMHLSFGSGIHHCIGAPLARQELNLGFAALLRRMEHIRLSSDHPPPVAEPSIILRRLPHVYIEFDRREGS